MAIEYRSTKTPVKTSTETPSGKLAKALDIIASIETEKRQPKKPFTKKRKVTSIRLQEEVETVLKENGVNISDLTNELLTNYALSKDWL